METPARGDPAARDRGAAARAQHCQKERDKAADAQEVFRYVLRPRQRRVG